MPPLKKGIRVLEIGCGPGAAAREIANRIGNGYVLGIDRSAKAIQQAKKNAEEEMRSGILQFRQCAIENFDRLNDEDLFDIAFAVRVGCLDGRHPELEQKALVKIARSLTKNGRLFIDGGKPLNEITLDNYR